MYEISETAKVWFERSKLDGLKNLHTDRVSEWGEFVPQLFGKLLFNSQTEQKPPKEQSQWVKDTFNLLESKPEWKSIQEASGYHPDIAAENTISLANAVAEAMDLDSKDKSNATSPQALKVLLDGLDKESADKLKKKIREGQEVREDMVAGAELTTCLLRAMKRSAEKSDKDKKAVKVLRGYGMGGDKNEMREEIPKELISLLSDNEILMKIIDKLGRLKKATMRQAAKSPSKRGVAIDGVKCGDKVEDLLASELVKLGNPIMKIDLLDRLQGKKALVWRKTSKDPKSRGDILMMVDNSASMQYESGYPDKVSAHEWASAVAAATILKAIKGKRKVEVIFFSDDIRRMRVNGKEDLTAFFKMLSVAPHGGTDIVAAMQEARKNEMSLNKPDGLMISDMCLPNDMAIPKLKCELKLALISDGNISDGESVKELIGANEMITINPEILGSHNGDSVASNIVDRV